MRWLGLVVLVPSVALARTPAEAEVIARTQIAPKLDLMCGMSTTVHYDLASLSRVDVGDACEEPLRYLYYVCQKTEARRAVQLAKLRSYECRGAKQSEGGTTIEHGKLVFTATADKHETDDHLTKLSKLLHLDLDAFHLGMYDKLIFGSPDPKWDAFVASPVPTDTAADYCIVDGKKGPLPPTGDPLAPAHVAVKCVHGGKIVTEMTADGDGYFTRLDGGATRFESYRHGRRHGESWLRKNGVVSRRELYDDGQKVWTSEFYEDGKLHRHSSHTGIGIGHLVLDEHDGVLELECGDTAAADPVLRTWCGFDRPRKIRITDPENPRTVIMTDGKARIAE